VDDELAELRRKAEACRRLAGMDEDAARKALWLERADHWEKLAAKVAQQPQPHANVRSPPPNVRSPPANVRSPQMVSASTTWSGGRMNNAAFILLFPLSLFIPASKVDNIAIGSAVVFVVVVYFVMALFVMGMVLLSDNWVLGILICFMAVLMGSLFFSSPSVMCSRSTRSTNRRL
jgi:anti-sigma factor RsiW